MAVMVLGASVNKSLYLLPLMAVMVLGEQKATYVTSMFPKAMFNPLEMAPFCLTPDDCGIRMRCGNVLE